MTKVTYAKLTPAKSPEKSAIKKEIVRDTATGKFVTIKTIRMDKATFGDAFTKVFQDNVAKARRENKRLLGVTDVKPAITR